MSGELHIINTNPTHHIGSEDNKLYQKDPSRNIHLLDYIKIVVALHTIMLFCGL